jgi:outer membrane protein assembly factor BamD
LPVARALRTALIALLTLASLALPTADANAQGRKSNVSAQDRYELCLRYMRRGYYTKAAAECNRVRNYHRDDPVSVLAELAVADINFKKGDYEQARLSYEDFARLHPRHRSMDYVTWRIGQCHYKQAPKAAGRDQTRTQQAVNVWTGFESRFPDSKYLAEVGKLSERGRDRLASKELFIGKYYRRIDQWVATQHRAETVLRRFPDSQHVPKALALLTEAYHRWGMVAEAKLARERLATDYPRSHFVGRADRKLARAPGAPTDGAIFVRPYTFAGMAGGGGQQGQPQR